MSSESSATSVSNTDHAQQKSGSAHHRPTQKLNNAGQPLADPALKWGKTPGTDEEREDEDEGKPDFSTYYPPEEQARLQAKGVNPALKAEMEWNRARHKGGFWAKVAGTAAGGGWIK